MPVGFLSRGDINLAEPINRSTRLTDDLLAWWKVLHTGSRGKRFTDLEKLNHLERQAGTPGLGGTFSRQHAYGSIIGDAARWYKTASTGLLGTASHTIAVWARWTTTTTVLRLWQQNSTAGFQLCLANYPAAGQIRYYAGSGNDSQSLLANATGLNDGVWRHFVFVRDDVASPDKQYIYINGVEDNSRNRVSGSDSDTAFAIFAEPAGGGTKFQGQIDDLIAWNRPLSAAEVQMLYRESLRGYPRLLNRRKRFIFSAPGATTHSRTISDTIGVSDNVARNWIANRLISDTLGLSDAVTASKGATSYNRTITDTIGVSDNVLRTWIANRLLSDSLGLSDNVQRQQIANRLISDTLGASDNTLRTWIANRLISDTLGISDLPTATTGAHNRTISDSLGISDNAQRTWIANRLISDTLGVSDNLARAWIAQRLISDQLGISDLPITQLVEPGGLTHNRTLSDTLGLSDNVERQQIVLRVLSDVLGLSDSFDRVAIFNRLVSDTLAVSDNIQRSVIYLRLLADTLGISDSIIATTIAEAELFVGSATTQRTGIVGTGTTQRTGIVGAATVARAQSDSATPLARGFDGGFDGGYG